MVVIERAFGTNRTPASMNAAKAKAAQRAQKLAALKGKGKGQRSSSRALDPH